MNKIPHARPLSHPIVHALNEVRKLLRRYVVLQAFLLVVIWLMLVFWLGGLLDYFPVTLGSSETPRWLRIGLLAAMGVGSLWIVYRYALSRLSVSIDDSSVALLIERKHPELNNELVTAVELSHRSDDEFPNPDAHRMMFARVQESITDRIKKVNLTDLFEWQPLWALGVATIFGLITTGVAAVGMSDWTGRWSRRLFALSDESWPRQAALRADGVQLQVPAFSTQLVAQRVMIPFVNRVVRIPVGAAALLQISADTSARAVPEVCTLFYRATDGARGRANLRRVGSSRGPWQQFTLDGPPLDGLTSDLQLDIVGLDARLRDLKIQVVQPAVIAQMKMNCIYPDYLRDSLSVRAAEEIVEYRSGATLPEGTDVMLLGSASSSLGRVEYVVHSSAAAASKSAASSLDNSAVGEPTVAPTDVQTAKIDGREFAIPLGKLSASSVVEVRLIDEFGLSAEQIPRYVVTVREDSIPVVNTTLNGIGIAVTPNAMLPIIGTIQDDHGVSDAAAELIVNESKPFSVPLTLDDGELKSVVDLLKLQEQFALQINPGSTLGMLVSAHDAYDLGEQRHVGRGQPFQLAVVTADQLIVILDRQELELRQRLELIVSELTQLREVLQTLKVDLNPPSSASWNRRSNTKHKLDLPISIGPVVAEQEGQQADRTAQVQRLAGLWAQQSVLQGDKSQQELSSVAARVDNLRQQLINNRIDSYDRQERLQTKVFLPLEEMLQNEYPQLSKNLLDLQTATQDLAGSQQAALATESLDQVLLKLDAILSNMQDIEGFNEIVDLVRDLLDDQEKLLNETEQEYRKRILEILK